MWTWEGQGFMPYYVFQPVNSIREIWEEWSRGLNGFPSMSDTMSVENMCVLRKVVIVLPMCQCQS